MNLKSFSKYLRKKSLEQELHRVRMDSLERIVAGESSVERQFAKRKPLKTKKTA